MSRCHVSSYTGCNNGRGTRGGLVYARKKKLRQETADGSEERPELVGFVEAKGGGPQGRIAFS